MTIIRVDLFLQSAVSPCGELAGSAGSCVTAAVPAHWLWYTAFAFGPGYTGSHGQVDVLEYPPGAGFYTTSGMSDDAGWH